MMWKGLRRFEVEEQSMAPALLPGDYVVTSVRPPDLGDIIAFDYQGKVLIKRLVGLPNEVVDLGAEGIWQLGDDELFAISDNRDQPTIDCRRFGPITRDRVIGRLIFRYWPLLRLGRVASSLPD